MFNLLRSRFRFCVDYTNYCVGEKVLHKLYYGDANRILSDAIVGELESLRGKDRIDSNVLQKYIDAFIPNKGILIENLVSQPQSRQVQAKNQNGKFAINPHPIIAPQLMKILYSVDDSLNNIKKLRVNRGSNIRYMLGSRGISKSTSFIILRCFHNMRIPYIIKNGLPKDSIFMNNIKMLYFNCDTQKSKIIEQMCNEIQKDFPQQIIKQLKPNKTKVMQSDQQFGKWVATVRSQYETRKRQISLRLIVDQVNMFYNDPKKYDNIIQCWSDIFPSFTNPTILIASMNNEQLPSKKDPIRRLARQNMQELIKIVLDNKITAKQRIQYGIQCLIFQLRKQNFTVQSIQQILNCIQQFPMTTHLSCRNFIQSQKINMQKSFLENSTTSSAAPTAENTKDIDDYKNNKLKEILINKIDLQILQKNIKSLKEKEQKQMLPQEKQACKDTSQVLGELIMVYNELRTQTVDFNYKKSLRQYSTLAKQILKQKQIQRNSSQQVVMAQLNYKSKQLQHLKNSNFTNYFFKQINLSGYEAIYCCLLFQQIKNIRHVLYLSVNLKIMRFYRDLFQSMDFNRLIKALIGGSYQAHITKMLQKQTAQLMSIQFSHEYYKRFKFTPLFFFKYFKQQTLPLFNNIQQKFSEQKKIEILNTKKTKLRQQGELMVQNGGCWFPTQNSNLGFDFLLTSFNYVKLDLYFIDASIGSMDQVSKINKFQNQILKNNEAFQFLINQLDSKQQITTIWIFFIILKPSLRESKYIHKYIMQNQNKTQILKNSEIKIVQNSLRLPSKVKIVQAYEFIMGTQFKIKNQERELNFKPPQAEAFQQFQDEIEKEKQRNK